MCYGVLCLQLRIILSWFYLFYLVMLIVQGQTDIWLKSGGVDVCISCWGLWGIKTEIKKRNKIIASDLKGFAVLFIFSLFLIHWNITFLENVSCFLIFDGNLTPNRNSSFHHSLNFCYGFLFSMCHFLKELKKNFFFSALTGMWDLSSPTSVPGFKPGPTAKCGGMEAWHLSTTRGVSPCAIFYLLFFGLTVSSPLLFDCNPRYGNCVRLSFVQFLANVLHPEVNEWQIMNPE